MSMRRTLMLTACLATGGAALAQPPSVAVDIAPVHALAARVMQGVATPSLVIQPGASPHEYALRPSEAAALQDADLVFWIGPALTPWMADAVQTLAADATVVSLMAADVTMALPLREGALFEAHSHDHGAHEHDDHAHDDHVGHDDGRDHDHDHDDHAKADPAAHDDHDHAKAEAAAHDHDDHAHDDHADDDHGHAHGGADPHVWLSPRNAAAWVTLIAGRLSAADPANASAYFSNAAAARAELEALTAEIDATLAPVRDGRFIVFHDAYQYFEDAFGMTAAGAISLSDATDPSPARIAEIQARIADQGVDCVLAEPQFNAGLVQAVLEGADASTGVVDPLGAALTPGPALYGALMRGMAAALAACLR